MFTEIKLSLAICFMSVNLSLVRSAKILGIFPTPSISHQIVFRPLMQELARQGHEVTVITTDPAFQKGQAPANYTEIDVHDLSYGIWIDALSKEKTGSKSDMFSQIETILRTMRKICFAQMGTKEVQNIIKKKQGEFDLLIIEAYLSIPLIFSHIFKVPTIQFSSVSGLKLNYEIVGANSHPLLYPLPFQQIIYNLSYVEKLQELYYSWQMQRIFYRNEEEGYQLLQKEFGQDIPSVRELSDYVQMVFLNVHPIWVDNQPVPPAVLYVRGIHFLPPKELPKDLKTILNTSKNGVIYFSLGTNVKPSVLPPDKIQMMLKVFSELPYDVIMKWDLDTIPGKPENVKIYKWLPQSDLLKHPKIKLFITQGGLQSTDEAIEAGVPLVGIPMFADQWFNTAKYPHHKIGIRLDLPSMTEEVFRGAIETVIFDKSYRENIKRLSSIISDEPQKPLERAVWWVEYTLRHGGANMKAAGANMTMAEYLELELVTIVVLVLLSVLLLFIFALYSLWRFISRCSFFKIKTS